jgi:hypothetical protein
MPQRQPEFPRRRWPVQAQRAADFRRAACLCQVMLVRWFSILTLAALLGCSKAPAPVPPPPGPAAAEPVSPPPPAPTAVPEAVPSDQAALAELLGQLTQVARKFAAEQQRVPQSLDELVSRGYLARVPAAPSGKAFTITRQLQVELRDQ